ncbi:MAG: glycerol-3-phosphate 1-O-acyltransferase PlsY [Verrucomicrobiales bacterium]
MSEILQNWWPVLAAYIVGATPFGFLAGKAKGVDIRDHGSGNIGATNVVRILGKPVGFTVLILDVCKGVFPVLIARAVSDSSAVHIAAAIAAIVGHNYTFWLKFKGGKGIATTGGAILPIMPVAFVVALLTWVVVLKVTRYVSVASIAAAFIIPLTIAVRSALSATWDPYVFGFGLFVCVLALWKHRSNIQRLRTGDEPRSGRKAEDLQPR